MAAPSWADSGLVFPNTRGKIRRRDSVMRSLRQFLEEAGLLVEAFVSTGRWRFLPARRFAPS